MPGRAGLWKVALDVARTGLKVPSSPDRSVVEFPAAAAGSPSRPPAWGVTWILLGAADVGLQLPRSARGTGTGTARWDLHNPLLPWVPAPPEVSDRVGARRAGLAGGNCPQASLSPSLSCCSCFLPALPTGRPCIPIFLGVTKGRHKRALCRWTGLGRNSFLLLSAALDLLLDSALAHSESPTELSLEFLAWFSPHSTLTCL